MTVSEPIAVTGVTLDQTEVSMLVGGSTVTLVPTVSPTDATHKDVTWVSSDSSVATVENGVITAVAAGTATITVTATNGTTDTSDDKTATCEVTVATPVAQIGDTLYASLQDAYEAVQSGETIKMIADCDLGETTVTSSKTYTLDLGGKTIHGSANPLIDITGGKLTVSDSNGNGILYNKASSKYTAVKVNGVTAKLDVFGGIIKCANGKAIENNGIVNIVGGQIISESTDATIYNRSNSILNISGANTLVQGNFTAIETTQLYNGTITISGDTLKSSSSAGAVYIRSGTVEISGGTFEGYYGLSVKDPGKFSRESTGIVTFTEDSTAVVKGSTGTFDKIGGTVIVK